MRLVRCRPAAIAAAAVALVAGCSSKGSTPRDTSPPISISIPPLATEPLPASLAPSYNTTGALPAAAHVAAQLLPVPQGATADASSWASNTTPTIDEFVSEKYGSATRSRVELALAQVGVDGIAHRSWSNTASNVEVVLLHIDGTATQAFLGYFIPDLPGGAAPFPVTTHGGDAFAARAKTASSDGRYEAAVVTMVGQTVVALNGTVDDPAHTSIFQDWANNQIARVRS